MVYKKKEKSKSHCLETKHVEVDTQYYDVAENPSHLTSGSYLENINSHSGPHVQAAGGEMGAGDSSRQTKATCSLTRDCQQRS